MRDPLHRPPADWETELLQSEAETARGDIVAGETVLAELLASLARLEAGSQNRSGAASCGMLPIR